MTLLNRQWLVALLTMWLPAVVIGQNTTWTDNTGKYRVEAQFLRLEKETVHLRNRDGKSIAVPLARLSAESRERAHQFDKEQKKASEGPLAVVPAEGAPPRLPAMPADLAWSESLKPNIDRAIANYEYDQVSAYLAFRDILDREDDGRTKQQKEWLEQAAAACRPRALAVVTADFVRAVGSGDLRTALVASIVAGKIHPAGLGDKSSSLAVLKNKLFSSQPDVQPVWKVAEVKASEVEGSYSEGNSFATNHITLTPKDGFRLVRVSAKVTNVSSHADLPYIKWSLGGLGTSFIDAISRDEAASNKPRLAMDEFIFLVTAGGDWINCGHVCESSSVLRQFSFFIQGVNSGFIAVGGYVSANDSFTMDVLFSVPEGIDQAKLLVLGANPEAISFKPVP